MGRIEEEKIKGMKQESSTDKLEGRGQKRHDRERGEEATNEGR